MENPFRPGFGFHPLVVVGRQALVGEISVAFDTAWSPYRKTYLRAPRGTGKTVLLDMVQDAASDRGWLIVEENAGTAAPPLLDRIQRRLRTYTVEKRPPAKGRTTGGLSLGPVSATHTWEPAADSGPHSLREELETVLQLPTGRPGGVLLSIDEIHEASRDEVATIANAIQHLERANLPIALILAGLPAPRESPGTPTFLARCQQPDIAGIDAREIARGFRDTAAIGGRAFSPHALDAAVQASGGLPYMMQMVGWQAFRNAETRPGDIELADVEAAVPVAARQLAQAVIDPTTRRLSRTDVEFLTAMAIDDGPTAIGQLAQRMGRNSQYVNVYRTRLLNAGLIRQVAHGVVDFAVPAYRAYLRTTTGPGLQQLPPPSE